MFTGSGAGSGACCVTHFGVLNPLHRSTLTAVPCLSNVIAGLANTVSFTRLIFSSYAYAGKSSRTNRKVDTGWLSGSTFALSLPTW